MLFYFTITIKDGSSPHHNVTTAGYYKLWQNLPLCMLFIAIQILYAKQHTTTADTIEY